MYADVWGLALTACVHACMCLVCIYAGVPAGYFMQGPGQVEPCPVGEYSTAGAAAAAPNGACQRCPSGVTTLAEASGSIAACTGML